MMVEAVAQQQHFLGFIGFQVDGLGLADEDVGKGGFVAVEVQPQRYFQRQRGDKLVGEGEPQHGLGVAGVNAHNLGDHAAVGNGLGQEDGLGVGGGNGR